MTIANMREVLEASLVPVSPVLSLLKQQRPEHAYHPIVRERVCCLLVLNSVTSTPQWIRNNGPSTLTIQSCAFVAPE